MGPPMAGTPDWKQILIAERLRVRRFSPFLAENVKHAEAGNDDSMQEYVTNKRP